MKWSKQTIARLTLEISVTQKHEHGLLQNVIHIPSWEINKSVFQTQKNKW